MALKVFGSDPLFLATTSELQNYLDPIFAENKRTGYMTADFAVVKDNDADIDSVLGIGLDYDSGYGALLWYCDNRFRDQVAAVSGTEIAEYVWVSWNPSPPEVDPQVLSDPWCPSFFNRVSAIPLSDVRPVIEEYFRQSTGFRPTGVEWIKGHSTGELYEESNEL
ncbi:Imm1 family immunity protein [Streptomyces sp. YIM S03343]